jgi:spoIIIJ-associated protein
MAKGKDFYGTDVTEVIARACKEFDASQEELDIEILETGSAGIFGLCKKKAHIRARLRATSKEGASAQAAETTDIKPEKKVDKKPAAKKSQEKTARKPAEKQAEKPAPAEPSGKSSGREEKAASPAAKPAASPVDKPANKTAPSSPGSGDDGAPKAKKSAPASGSDKKSEPVGRELPSAEVLTSIEEDIVGLLEVMGFPSSVEVEVVDYSVACRISGEHQEALVGSEGRTLDSLQYLLRKMMSRRLPDRMMLSLDVGNYREQRAEDLKVRARELAAQVKEDGKTQAIPALNPSERRVVHMLLQEDKDIRSRSVGEGLFKKVLIYKPGKKKKSGSRKGKGRQGGRSSGNN